MNLRSKILLFLVIPILAGTFLYLIQRILLPFILAIVFSYFLAPLVYKLQNYKLSRTISTIIVFTVLGGIIGLLTFTIMPIIYKQMTLLLTKAYSNKHYIDDFSAKVLIWLDHLDPEYTARIKEIISNFSHELLNFFSRILSQMLTSGMVAINVFFIIFVTPVLMFYLLMDWENFVDSTRKLLPKKLYKTLKPIFSEIDTTLSGYVRGQISVCLIMGLFYGIGLSIVGLDSGLALGFIAGFLTFIPYIGITFSLLLSILIAALQSFNLLNIIFVISVFVLGQIIEGNFITPNLVGKRIKIHPVWLIFALLAGGNLFGIFGVIVAIPLTAILGVIIRFAITRYKNSEIYNH
jgi:predicted PurR-regulated permease PerM